MQFMLYDKETRSIFDQHEYAKTERNGEVSLPRRDYFK